MYSKIEFNNLGSILLKTLIVEINLKYNSLNDRSIDDFSSLIFNKENKLKKIDLSYNSFTYIGMLKLLRAMKNDRVVNNLNISNNNIEGEYGDEITYFFKKNKGLKNIDMSHCKINTKLANAIALGLSMNKTLKSINLSGNLIEVRII